MLVTAESNAIIYLISLLPTAHKRINARNKFKEMTIKSIDAEILRNRELLRELRSESESAKRGVYQEISRLEATKDAVSDVNHQMWKWG